MYTHEELLRAIDSFEPSESLSNQTKAEVKAVATQIGFNAPDATCKCKDKYNDLIIKLKLWRKEHFEPVHYTMKRGIIRKGPDGKNIFALNLNDAKAEWLLQFDPEAPKYIKKIADYEPVQKESAEPTESSTDPSALPESAGNEHAQNELEELFESNTEQPAPEAPAETKTKKKSKKKH